MMIESLRDLTLGSLLFAYALGVSAQLSGLQEAAEQRARALAAAISTGNRGEFRRFVSENFGGDMLNIPMPAHLNLFSQLYDGSRGYEIQSVGVLHDDAVTAVLRNELTGGWVRLNVVVEPHEPHRIVGARFLPGESPDPTIRRLSDRQIGRELGDFLRRLADTDVFSGAVLLARNGTVLLNAAYGMANKDFSVPNDIDTKFNFGSMNKMFTAVSIMQLVEAGKLSLDDPLDKFLPDFPSAAAAAQIRIEHLLTHTSGLGSFFGPRFRETSKLELRTIDQLLEFSKADEELAFEPGTRWQYSNTGYLVLGKIIEVVSGDTYDDFVRKNIYEPAGMHATSAHSVDEVNPSLAVGYDKRFTDEGVVFRNNLFLHLIRGGPAGGGYSTVGDLLSFDRALRGNELLEPKTTQLMLTAKPEANSPGYGYGFEVHDGGSIVGHSGGFPGINSQLDMFLDSGWTAIVMSNYTNGGVPVVQKMRELVAAASPTRAR